MERKVLVVCSVVGLLGLLSVATAFAAEATKIKGSQVQVISDTQCSYPRTPALGLGQTAVISLLLAHVIINASSGCICCTRRPQPPTPNWNIALLCFCVSWFTFVIAFLLLLTGTVLNSKHGVQSMYFSNYYCYVVKPGVFSGGALLSAATVVLGIVYYLKLKGAKSSSATSIPNQGSTGIAMGQPQMPETSQATQDPVFVHEDTYMRRQFT